jgi:hypothetical protein
MNQPLASSESICCPIAGQEFFAVSSGYRQILDFLYAHGIVEAPRRRHRT